jgi:acyl-CoA synthetase (AMP-forming)/AMP-acid ligase II
MDEPGILEKRVVPTYLKKFRRLVLQNRSISSTNFVDRLADVYEDRPVFFLDRGLAYPFFSGTEVSYRTLSRFTNRIGNALTKLGVKRGDRVGLVTYNRVELAFAEFACMKIGAIPVPLNFMLKANEINYQMENSGARVLIVDDNVFRDNIQDPQAVPAIKTWIMVSKQEKPQGFYSLGEIMTEASESLAPAVLSNRDDPVLIFYTSGTTGVPRGAMLTDRNLMSTVQKYCLLFGLLPTNRRQMALLVMPVAHTSGHQNLLILLSMAIPMYFASRFKPDDILGKIERYRATFFAGIPAMFKMMLAAGAERFDLTSIQVWGGGADAFPPELVTRFRDLSRRRKWGIPIKPLFVHGYGMAETAGHICISPPWGPRCAGWVIPGIKYRLMDPLGNPVKKGEPGELQIKGPIVMKGYWNDPKKTDGAFQDGWFCTGDIMRMGKWRVLEFVDREKDVIKCGGYSIFPTELEHHLAEHPKIERAVVVGVPHKIKGEMPIAVVQIKDGEQATEEELEGWADQRIALYKRPRRYLLRDSIPMTFSLKPLRKDLRELAVSTLGEGWDSSPGGQDRDAD